MRKACEAIRNKRTYNITQEEIKKGDWLKLIPDDIDKFELLFKSNFLIIKTMKLEKGELENANERTRKQ